MKIYCPICRWQPTADARWICQPGCDHCWNTFDTHGRCPQCGKVWRNTRCLVCLEWSKHEHWYHDLEPAVLEEFEASMVLN